MKATDIRSIVVAGAGTMGASMAQIFAKYGYSVTQSGIYGGGM